jgi:tRNA modification GTPase
MGADLRVAPPAFQFALLTPPGRGAVATISIIGDWCGSESASDFPFTSATPGRTLSEQPVGRLWYGTWGAEQVVVGRVETDRWEVYCHGGPAAVGAICGDLLRLGGIARDSLVEGESTFSGLADELQIAVQQAPTWRVAERLLRYPVAALVETLTAWSVQLRGAAGGFDFETAHQTVDGWLARATFGRHLIEPWNVLLVGEPNVGKSSLLNRLAGFERAIVHHEPGTTRDLVTVTTAIDGWPVRLIDSAGIRSGADPLETLGIARALDASRDVNLILHLYDASRPESAAETELRKRWPEALRVAHKCDLSAAADRGDDPAAIPVSSQTGAGADRLLAAIVARLVPDVPALEASFPINSRQEGLMVELRSQLAARAVSEVDRTLRELRDGVDRR